MKRILANENIEQNECWEKCRKSLEIFLIKNEESLGKIVVS